MTNIGKHLSFFLVFLPLGTTYAPAQTDTITYAKAFDTRNLRGRVGLNNTRDPLEGVLVEECTSDWKTVVQSTRTDYTGHFQLRRSLVKGVHNLRFSMPGMHTIQIKVRIFYLSPKSGISIEMAVAT